MPLRSCLTVTTSIKAREKGWNRNQTHAQILVSDDYIPSLNLRESYYILYTVCRENSGSADHTVSSPALEVPLATATTWITCQTTVLCWQTPGGSAAEMGDVDRDEVFCCGWRGRHFWSPRVHTQSRFWSQFVCFRVSLLPPLVHLGPMVDVQICTIVCDLGSHQLLWSQLPESHIMSYSYIYSYIDFWTWDQTKYLITLTDQRLSDFHQQVPLPPSFWVSACSLSSLPMRPRMMEECWPISFSWWCGLHLGRLGTIPTTETQLDIVWKHGWSGLQKWWHLEATQPGKHSELWNTNGWNSPVTSQKSASLACVNSAMNC